VDAHVVPQIVEAHLVVGAIGDVRGVSGLPLLGGQAVDDQAHLQAQEAVDLAHPLTVALGQVVVHRDDVDAPAGQGVQIGGQSGYQGLALAGLHLGDPALVQHDAAHQL
ncbi:Core-binding (CB) domain-containing protein, partial [Dysosmobacter welbionis]